MFGMASLDVMIGIITVYLIFALACTAIVEVFSAWCEVRSKNLEVALTEFLHGSIADGSRFVDAFFAHPVVQTLSVGEHGRPSYITPEIAGQVIVALINAKEDEFPLRAGIDRLPGTIRDNRIKGLLDALYREAGEDLGAFRKLLENHYDEAMDRASGWYKRKTQTMALVVSAAMVVLANVDTVDLANSLSSNPAARAKMVELAQQYTDKPGAPQISPQDAANLATAGIRLGWHQGLPGGMPELVSKAIGLLVSVLAISLGAPFWFDMLKRVMQVRAAGASPRDKKAEK